jgi:hypothetical protein
MDRQQLLDLYDWALGTCFRHPSKGPVPTAVIGVVHPQPEGERQVRACADCVITLEDVRRERLRRAGGTYEPGRLADPLG